MFISIAITTIVFFGLMYLIGTIYCELNDRIEQLESELEMYKDMKNIMNSKIGNMRVLTNKDIDKKVSERNKKLIEKLEKDSDIHDENWKGLEIEKYAKEILKILKGENDE